MSDQMWPERPTSEQPGRGPRPMVELLLVLGVSLGESAVYSVLRIVDLLTRPKPLSSQKSTLNSAVTPDRPWLDLLNQLANIAFPLVPVLLACYLLTTLPGRTAWNGDDPGLPAVRRIGADRRQPGRDALRGLAVAAAIGIPGLAFYLVSRTVGINTTVQAANLGDHWWTIPVYVLSAAMNGTLEEFLMLGYLFCRLSQWRQLRAERAQSQSPKAKSCLVSPRVLGVEAGRFWWPIIAASAVLRGSYHLYQGFGGFIGNLVMGLAFGWLFLRWKRVLPLVVAHTLLDIAAFCGYALLAGRVSWL